LLAPGQMRKGAVPQARGPAAVACMGWRRREVSELPGGECDASGVAGRMQEGEGDEERESISAAAGAMWRWIWMATLVRVRTVV